MQGWKTENCSLLPKALEMVNANTYIQRRNINRIERDSMDGSEEKEVGYTCEYRFLSEDEYYNLLQQEEKGASFRCGRVSGYDSCSRSHFTSTD